VTGAASQEWKRYWTCACCGDLSDTLPTSWNAECPDDWLAVSETDRELPSFVDTDLCRIRTAKGNRFFVRAILEAPIVEHSKRLMRGIWVSVSEPNFYWAKQVRDLDDVGEQPEIGGFVNNQLMDYPDTSRLFGRLQFRNNYLRPLFIVDDDIDHPLAREQREGIRIERVHDMAMRLMPHGSLK
jgi:hypothetical protein